jgi:hypothetical protein
LWTATCPILGSSLSPTHCWPICLSSLCLLKVPMKISSLPSPLLWCTYSIPPPLLCAPFQFLIIQFFCVSVWGGGVSLSSGLGWLVPGVAVGIPCALICSPVGLMDVSQAGLEPVSGGAGALLFFRCNMVQRSFVQPGGSGCCSPESSLCFFSAKCGPSISAMFLIHKAHTVCFCALITMLDPPLSAILKHTYVHTQWPTCEIASFIFCIISAFTDASLTLLCSSLKCFLEIHILKMSL